MITISSHLRLILQLATTQAAMSRRFDGRLQGLGLTEFLILWNLDQAKDQTMRRVDLAESIGLTASGVTRLLAPMEKIGLVKREVHTSDARVSLVSITKSGARMLQEALENAEDLAQKLLANSKTADIACTAQVLATIASGAR